jgi:phosphatidylinositol kinase/protein kinase (PI-3  family)
MCETVIRAVRGARWALEAVLAIFIDQPAVPSKTNVKASLMRVGEKLQGQVGGTLMSVEEQVEQLINEARDPKNYVRHYLGWCPFW